MSGNGREARERLFNLYTRNLAQYDPDVGDAFVCPLCLGIFPREFLHADPPGLTLAHIIPQSLGGTTCILACAGCNSDNGATLERFLLERFRQEDWLQGVGTVNARLRMDCEDVGVEMGRKADGGFELRIIGPQSNPASIRALRERLTEFQARGDLDFSFNLRWQVLRAPRIVEAAVCQSAYLLLFSHFGYEAVGHPHFKPFAEWLRHPHDGTFKPCIVVLNEEKYAPLLSKNQHALVFLRQPRVVFAVLRFVPKKGLPRVFGVLLPGLEEPALPDITLGKFTGGFIEYQPDALTESPWYMWRLWNEYHQSAASAAGAEGDVE